MSFLGKALGFAADPAGALFGGVGGGGLGGLTGGEGLLGGLPNTDFLGGGGGGDFDAGQLAQQQTSSNVQTAIAQALLNQQRQVTPFGTLDFSQIGETTIPGTDIVIPRFEQTQTLSPLGQQQFDTQQRISNLLNNLAESNIGNVEQAQSQQFGFENFGAPTPQVNRGPLSQQGTVSTGGTQITPLGAQGALPGAQGTPLGGRVPFANLAQIPQSAGAFAQQGRQAEQASFQRALSLLNPEFARQQNELNVNLSERGLPLSSQAAQGVIDPFERRRNEALNTAAFSALGAGRSEQERLLNQAFQSRQQGIQEQSLLRSQPINEIATLLGTSPGLAIPQFNPFSPSQIGESDVLGAGLAQQGFQQQNRSANLQGLFSLGAAAAAAFSDIRVKENIKPYGYYKGHRLYSYNYIWEDEPQIGVMAQEIEKTIPGAVSEINGIKRVNYGLI